MFYSCPSCGNGPVTINELDENLVNEAITAAKNSDLTIVFAGSNRDYETEASDRANLDLPYGQEELIHQLLEVNPNTIVVFIAGAPFDIKAVSDKSKAVIWTWFNGSEGGNALADVLLGNINPSGKLPWTMPVKLEDSPAHATNSFPGDDTVTYEEGILVGYRWFDTKNIEPLYPFGYGDSYTSFELGDLSINKSEFSEDETIDIKVAVKNTGDWDGKEVVQAYISKPNTSIERATNELKGFTKVEVDQGSTAMAYISIPVKELAFYNTDTKNWEVEKGTYIIKIGNSSRNLTMETSINIL